eukprot:1212364-Alexandrium_andersonii.AAC.1
MRPGPWRGSLQPWFQLAPAHGSCRGPGGGGGAEPPVTHRLPAPKGWAGPPAYADHPPAGVG